MVQGFLHRLFSEPPECLHLGINCFFIFITGSAHQMYVAFWPCLIKNVKIVRVLDPGEGVCADPVYGGAILGGGGPDPQGGNKGHQLRPDKGRGKT
jgi:hypothetical protein